MADIAATMTEAPPKAPAQTAAKSMRLDPHSQAAAEIVREKFLPLTRAAVLDRVTVPELWADGEAKQVRRFLTYLNHWRRHAYAMKLLDIEQVYEPFSPDTDLLQTRTYTAEDRAAMQRRLVDKMCDLLVQANYTRIDPESFDIILTKDSHYGLDLHVDVQAFEEVAIFYRGATNNSRRKRDIRKAYLGWRDVNVPVFQRLFILFKLKPVEMRVEEVMKERNITRKEAERVVKRLRALLPESVNSDFVYMKLFKNMPRSDVEMIFPNTRVRFRLFDKIKFGVTAGSGLGVGAVTTASKIAIASNPVTLFMALAGLGGVAVRQASNFVNQRNRYMVVMARNLYFHSLADNRGVMTLLADRAAEEDVKEEMLLYGVLARRPASAGDLKAIDEEIERYLKDTFDIDANFDLEDALKRLKEDGIVSERADGTLDVLRPDAAAARIDRLWDMSLDNLTDGAEEGRESDDPQDIIGAAVPEADEVR